MLQQPKDILRNYWGYDTFRGSQEQIVQELLQGNDVVALMPTGGGKSLCYQLPALAQDGICVVVSPLVALIQNQVDELKKKGVKAIALTGGISFDALNDLLDNCIYGNYKFVYISPERLQQTLVQERMQEMNVNLIAIDEAHCISQWGHDFRPAYLQCSVIRELHPEVPMVALTATATADVTKDIIESLRLRDPFISNDTFERKNIFFSVKNTEDKRYHLLQALKADNNSAIIYVRTRRKTVEVADYLNKNGYHATFYHGGLAKVEKKTRLQAWLNDETRIMVATNAFGMGIDKADVRQVIHFQLPDSIENYFQEAGRAGRDGRPSRALLLTNPQDKVQAEKQFLQTLPDAAFVKTLYARLNAYLQIAYGEGSGMVFGLNFNAFCHRYQFNPLIAYSALRLLDQNSVLALSAAVNQKTTVQFIAPKEGIFTYLEGNSSIAQVVLTLLRTYGGIFDYETRINTYLLAKKTNQSEKTIKTVLEKLHADEIAICQMGNEDLELTFLTPREDEKTINRFAKKIDALNQTKLHHLQRMLAYVENIAVCRSVFILNYFGQEQKACGNCDICSNDSKVYRNLTQVKGLIVKALDSKPKSARAIVAQLGFDEKDILLALRELSEEETIKVNHTNEYERNN
ncbi:ATP-dependent DNA helicase RecQ [uncultured Croceitalea sp.]|uniref:RecQ family ATP-dependent DNA helicase n=1 Tax=uncultured Croceitalea sp. TaxID=1798908 RepID=UPI003306677F